MLFEPKIKTMGRVLKLFKSMFTVLGISFFSSCTVTCDEGYEEKHCTTEIREKFLYDSYSVSVNAERDSCGNTIVVSPFNDTASIIPGVNVNEIKFTNVKLKNNYVTLVGKVDADNNITISQQIVSSHTFTGTGSYNNGNPSISYSAIKDCDTTTSSAVYTR